MAGGGQRKPSQKVLSWAASEQSWAPEGPCWPVPSLEAFGTRGSLTEWLRLTHGAGAARTSPRGLRKGPICRGQSWRQSRALLSKAP